MKKMKLSTKKEKRNIINKVIKKACRRLDYKFNDDENCDFDLYWADTAILP